MEPTAAPPVPAAPAPKLPLKVRFKALMEEYGTIAIATYFGIFFLVIGGFWLAIRFGVEVEGTAGTAGTLAAAWVATKLTQPLRILGTLLLTPIIGKLVHRFRKQPPAVSG